MHRLALQLASLKACRAPNSLSRGASVDPGAELRYVVACAAFVGAVRGGVEAAVTTARLAQLGRGSLCPRRRWVAPTRFRPGAP